MFMYAIFCSGLLSYMNLFRNIYMRFGQTRPDFRAKPILRVGPPGSKIRTGQVGLKWIKIRVQPRILFIKPDFWASSGPKAKGPIQVELSTRFYNLYVRSKFWDSFQNFLKIANFS